jgi:hypothetical protein
MKKKKTKEITLSKLFLTDHALQDSKNDAFGHNDYALLLEKLVREQPTPFNIGIFGKWGVGKSTIVNLLKEKFETDIKRKKIKFIEVKVWKYDEKISLTRKFIVKIAEDLGLSDDLNELNKEIYYDQEFETALLNFREIVSTVFNKKSIALWLMVGSIALLILFRILNIINVENVLANKIFKICEDTVLIPLVTSIFFWIIDIIKKAKLKLKVGKFDSDEQFEKKFIELIKKDESKKIIFIDDLDRCSKEKVVKTLETIKTFLDVESCIFIIACDDEIIKNAVNKANELYKNHGTDEGSEYLEKFFQYTFRIPPFMSIDLKKFIRNLLKNDQNDLLRLGNQLLEDIIFITINNNIKSPRNAITALNDFSTSYLLAQNREIENSSKLHNKVITDNLPVLAIVTSIKSQFPEFYSDILKNVELISLIQEILEGNQEILKDNQKEICKKYFLLKDKSLEAIDQAESEKDLDKELEQIDWSQPRNESYRKLFNFIKSVKDYLTVKDISPFLYLGIDTTSYLIGDEYLQKFNEALKYGYENDIAKIIEEADEERKVPLYDHMIDLIEDNLEDRKSTRLNSSHH